ncbi:extracellular solute-binding protein [Microvirga terricola]|uniref:Extracellular solute-binding protein n=1 Tax=Microvirga terricola TaxID=2719797 RepID=A0ABX0VB27_9HYPH|nr:extracellular solute-binding protein [Microvirga terricola]NIX76384.1 extracellular solute-binding protein [Microvirga terricola]
MKLTRRILMGAAVGGYLLSGAAAMAKTELTFWSWRQEDKAFYQDIIKKFEAKEPEISVKFETYAPENYQTILSTALAAGRGPDVIQVRAYGNLETIATPGYLLALDKQSVPELANFPDSALAAETVRADGKVYAVPFATQTMLVVYNKKIFKDAGVNPPQTWDELVALTQALKAKNITPFANGTATAWQNETIVAALLSSQLGKQFEDDIVSGKANFTDARFVNALAKLKDISANFSPNFTGVDYPSSQQLFVAGRAAMFAGGSFEVANFKSQNPSLDLGVFASPVAKAGDERLIARYYDGGYAVNAKSDKKDAAVKFIRFLATPDYGTAFTNQLKNLSPIKGIKIEDPITQDVAKLADNSMSYLMLVRFRYQEPSGSVLLQSNVQKMLAGQQTPEQAAAEINKGITTYYKPFQK